LLNC